MFLSGASSTYDTLRDQDHVSRTVVADSLVVIGFGGHIQVIGREGGIQRKEEKAKDCSESVSYGEKEGYLNLCAKCE